MSILLQDDAIYSQCGLRECMQTVQESLAIAKSVIASLGVAKSVKVRWSFPQQLACAHWLVRIMGLEKLT